MRKFWPLSLFLASASTVLVGKLWLFAEACCPHLQDAVLYTTAAVGMVIVLLWAALARRGIAAKLAVLSGGILLVAAAAGLFLSTLPQVQVVYCPAYACEQAEFARSLREEGKLETAEETARTCLEREPATPNEAACQERCAWELAMMLYQTSDPCVLDDVLRSSVGVQRERGASGGCSGCWGLGPECDFLSPVNRGASRDRGDPLVSRGLAELHLVGTSVR